MEQVGCISKYRIPTLNAEGSKRVCTKLACTPPTRTSAAKVAEHTFWRVRHHLNRAEGKCRNAHCITSDASDDIAKWPCSLRQRPSYSKSTGMEQYASVAKAPQQQGDQPFGVQGGWSSNQPLAHASIIEWKMPLSPPALSASPLHAPWPGGLSFR